MSWNIAHFLSIFHMIAAKRTTAQLAFDAELKKQIAFFLAFEALSDIVQVSLCNKYVDLVFVIFHIFKYPFSAFGSIE